MSINLWLEFFPGYFLRRKLTLEEKEILKNYGMNPCDCCDFSGISVITSGFCIDRDKDVFTVHIHGIGYDPIDEDDMRFYGTAQEQVEHYLKTTKDIDCGKDFEKFLTQTLEGREKYLRMEFEKKNLNLSKP